MQMRFIIGILCFVMATAILPVQGKTVLISNFDDTTKNSKWLRMPPARKDWRSANTSISNDFRSNGKHSLKVIFTKHQPGSGPLVMLEPSIDNGALCINDWTPYRRMLVDIYNPSHKAEHIKVRISDISFTRYFYKSYKLEPGWNTISFSVADIAKRKVNTAKVTSVGFRFLRPTRDIVLYFDNFRLSTDSGDAWNAAKEPLAAAVKGLDQLQQQVYDGSAKLKGCEQDIAAHKGKYEDCLNSVTKIRDNLSSAVIKAVALLGLPEAQGTGASRKELNFNRANKISNLSYLAEKVGDSVAEAKLLERVAEEKPDNVMVFGQIKHPDVDNISYSPRTYAGKLIDTVSVAAAGNETRSACILLIPVKGTLKNLTYRVSDLTNGTRRLPSQNILFCPLAYRRDSFKDAAFGYLLRPDIKKFNIPADVQQGFWLNVSVPEGTPAGKYSGSIVFSADGIKPQALKIKLQVYNFSIPAQPTLPVAVHSPSSITVNKDALDIMKHRCEPGSIYTWNHLPRVDRVRLWVDNGAQMIPLLRISVKGKKVWKKDAKGKVIDFSDNRKNDIYKRLRAVVPAIKEAGLLDKCYLYGFDEPAPEWIPAMNKVFGDLKKEFGLKTMFSTYQPIWEYHEIKNADYWAVTWNLLTPERIAEFHRKGRKLYSYNMAITGQRGKLQFWSAYKSGLDGMLQYKLNAAADQTPKTEFPLVNAKLGSVRMPDLKGMKNFNIISFEMWREGSEDYEYLNLLRQKIKELEKGKSSAPKHADLLFRAKATLFYINNAILPIHLYYAANFDNISLDEFDKFRLQVANILEEFANLK